MSRKEMNEELLKVLRSMGAREVEFYPDGRIKRVAFFFPSLDAEPLPVFPPITLPNIAPSVTAYAVQFPTATGTTASDSVTITTAGEADEWYPTNTTSADCTPDSFPCAEHPEE